MVGFGLSEEMFNDQRINFHTFAGNANGSAKEHKFRVLPAYAQGKLFHKVGLHWGFKTVDGKMKAITCSLEDKGSCPICDKVNSLKGKIETIEASLNTEFDPETRQQLESQKADMTEYISDHRRKPMYLWNIITEEGDQKVLQLSWNGHDPLFEKIKFIYANQKIDITKFDESQLMYCSRTGVKAKTRYQYEMLPGYGKSLADSVTKLTDLSLVYSVRSLEEIKEIVDTEIVKDDKQQIADKNFDAKPTGQQVPQNIQNDIPSTAQETAQPTQTLTAADVPDVQAETKPKDNNEAIGVPSEVVEMNQQQDAAINDMMAALNR